MTVLGTLYARRRKLSEAKRHRARLGETIRGLLGLRAEDVLTIGEFVCRHPGCSAVDTIVVVERPGRQTESLVITRALADITRSDLERAVAENRDRKGVSAGDGSP